MMQVFCWLRVRVMAQMSSASTWRSEQSMWDFTRMATPPPPVWLVLWVSFYVEVCVGCGLRLVEAHDVDVVGPHVDFQQLFLALESVDVPVSDVLHGCVVWGWVLSSLSVLTEMFSCSLCRSWRALGGWFLLCRLPPWSWRRTCWVSPGWSWDGPSCSRGMWREGLW